MKELKPPELLLPVAAAVVARPAAAAAAAADSTVAALTLVSELGQEESLFGGELVAKAKQHDLSEETISQRVVAAGRHDQVQPRP